MIPPFDSVALRGAMEELADDEKCFEMWQAAMARFERLFSAPQMGVDYTAFYRRIMEPDGS